jgi:hypothetical protein
MMVDKKKSFKAFKKALSERNAIKAINERDANFVKAFHESNANYVASIKAEFLRWFAEDWDSQNSLCRGKFMDESPAERTRRYIEIWIDAEKWTDIQKRQGYFGHSVKGMMISVISKGSEVAYAVHAIVQDEKND